MLMYFHLFKNSFQSNLEYKFDAVCRFILQLLIMIVEISVWTALYKWNGLTLQNNIALDTMIHYVILSTGVSALVKLNTIPFIDNKVKTGALATDFIKPMNFMCYTFSVCIGENVYNFVFRFLPLLLIFIPVFGMSVPSIGMLLLFILSIIGSIIIYFLFSFTFGLISFWYMSIWHLQRVLNEFIVLLAGSIVPLWFFPDPLYRIAMILPFRFIFFVPISIYLEQVTIANAVSLLLQQLLWIIILYLICKLVWSRGKHKLVIQGG